MGPIEFAVSTPATDDVLRENIAHALSLGLPEADCKVKHLNLIANGPSARRLRLSSLEGDTMALNGSIDLFTKEGGYPTYWIGCDPQENLANLLIDAPDKTVYLVASKCHPKVFDRLWDRDVRLWHVNDIPIPDKRQVPCAVSVTICALLLAQRLGYRSVDVHGWDCCYENERHHAGHELATGLPATSQRITIKVGGEDNADYTDPTARYFDSNPTWACEINDAKGVLPVVRWAGTEVKIHGPSMIAAILPEFAA